MSVSLRRHRCRCRHLAIGEMELMRSFEELFCTRLREGGRVKRVSYIELQELHGGIIKRLN